MPQHLEARYPGTCLRGRDQIDVGDLLVHDEELDAWVHAGCAHDPADEPAPAPPCTTCWQVPSVSGACGCPGSG